MIRSGFLGMAMGWGRTSGLEFGELAARVLTIMNTLEDIRAESMDENNWKGDDKLEFVGWCENPGLPALRSCHARLLGLSENFIGNAGQQAQASARHG